MKKVTVEELWETGQELLSYDEWTRPISISDLSDVEGCKILSKKGREAEVEINGCNLTVRETKVQHRGGSMLILEVI